jgi:multicomponent Na+:H+ antiporter subunit G
LKNALPVLLPRFVVLLVFWLVLDGPAGWDRASGRRAGDVAQPEAGPALLRPYFPLGLLAFCVHFLWGLAVAGVDVAIRAFHPRLPLRAGFVACPCGISPGPWRDLFLAASSLMPDSLPVEEGADGRIILHALTVKQPHAAQMTENEVRLARALGRRPPDAWIFLAQPPSCWPWWPSDSCASCAAPRRNCSAPGDCRPAPGGWGCPGLRMWRWRWRSLPPSSRWHSSKPGLRCESKRRNREEGNEGGTQCLHCRGFLGAFFFLAGTVGLLRFPDTLTRLHALTKADNLGLGLIMLGLLPQVVWPFGALKLFVVWVLVMVASAGASQLGARGAEETVNMEAIFSFGLASLSSWRLAVHVAVGRGNFAWLSVLAYGLLLSLTWMGLSAPDVALTEAALGGGVTGALLLRAQDRLRSGKDDQEPIGRFGRAAALLLGLWWLFTEKRPQEAFQARPLREIHAYNTLP